LYNTCSQSQFSDFFTAFALVVTQKPLDYYAFTKKQVGCTVKTFTSSATQFRAEQEEDVEEDEEAEEESAKQKLKTGQ